MGMCLNSLADCMMTRYTNFSENLWRVAVSALNAIILIGLPAVNIAYVNDDKPPNPQVWSSLVAALRWCVPVHVLPRTALSFIPE